MTLIAIDKRDKRWAQLSWVPGLSTVSLALYWHEPRSLTHRHARVALPLYLISAGFFFPAVICAYGFGGSKSAFWAGWIMTFGTLMVATVVGVVLAACADTNGPSSS